VPNTNGWSVKRAVLYARVSGEDQAKKGYSLADQLDTLRDWCSTNDYEVIDEVQDRGFSGAYLERPGLDRVREMVADGRVDAVVVLFRDRIARGVYAQLLSEEFRGHGARLVALNSRGDDSPDGELGDNILDVIAAWERKKIAERMNRGKRRKAREGKLVACPQSDYGFRYNDTRDGYEVFPPKMALVQRIFRMVGIEGMTMNAVARRFEAEGIPSPGGKRYWNRPGLRKLILSDVYLARTFEEVTQIVSPEVAARLDPEKRYGISWYGRQRHTYTQEVRVKDGKKTWAARVDQLERDREALLNHYSRIVPEHLDGLEPRERNRVYKMLNLTVLAHENGSLELKWALGADLCRDIEPLPPGGCRTRGR
jgi:site-specific DNA recombinase